MENKNFTMEVIEVNNDGRKIRISTKKEVNLILTSRRDTSEPSGWVNILQEEGNPSPDGEVRLMDIVGAKL